MMNMDELSLMAKNFEDALPPMRYAVSDRCPINRFLWVPKTDELPEFIVIHPTAVGRMRKLGALSVNEELK